MYSRESTRSYKGVNYLMMESVHTPKGPRQRTMCPLDRSPRTVIGVELDPHCHLTLKRVRLSDIIVLYKEFPHTGAVERAEGLLRLMLRTIRGEIRPVMSLYDCRQIGSYPTTLPLMRGFVDRIKGREGADGILSISIGHCFPYADVPELSGRVLMVGDAGKAKADRVAIEIGREFVAMHGRTAPDYLPVDIAIGKALAAGGAPAVLTEPADNAGGGAPPTTRRSCVT